MNIRNSVRWNPPDYKAYVFGAVGFLLAFGLRFYLHPLLGEHFPSLLFSINCIVLAYFYGFWPSFVFLIISIPLSLYYFIEPFEGMDKVIDTDVTDQIVFFIISFLTAMFFEKLRREQYQSVLLQRVSESRFKLLVENDEELRSVIYASKSANDIG